MDNRKLFLTVKDHSVSKENFELYRDNTIDLVYTQPQPNEQQLSKYYDSEDYISHTDGKRTLFEKAYHFVKTIALKNKVSLINNLHTAKGNLLDIGAGTGDFLFVATTSDWNAVGVEPNIKAKQSATNKGVFIVNTTEELENNSFDIITMWHVLEHVPNIGKQIQELKRLLKRDGSVLIAVPNFNSYDAKHYGVCWAAYDVPRHFWHFSQTAVQYLFEKEGFVLEKVLPMKFDSFYVSLLSEKYKTGKMNFVKAFYMGCLSNWKARSNSEYSSLIYILKNTKT